VSRASSWRAAAALAGLLATACGPAGKTIGVQVADEDVKAGQAAALVGQGHYAAFKKAVSLYAELYPERSLRRRVAVPYAEACLLLAMRLDRMLDLGYWLIGEAHYWLSWNLHGLERDQEAAEHIEEAKRRLPTNSEVFGLAGTIALDRGELERAEKDFLESLEYNAADIESLVGLGTVASRKRRWADAGGFFERAGRACGDGAAALRAKIEELQRSALSEERKSGMILRRRAQLERVLLTEATAWYDAAAASLNAGAREKALECVRKSAGHPALKDKSEELLKAIRPPLPD